MTTIEWTDKTANPITVKPAGNTKNGWHYCIKVSPGCQNCYAERMNKWQGNGMTYNAKPQGHPEMALNVEMLQSWARMTKSKKIFVGSMTDVFGEWVPDWMLFTLLDAMTQAPRQIFQLLTKRPERASEVIGFWLRHVGRGQLPANIWLGASAENQATYIERSQWLARCLAQTRFLSLEPLLGPIDLGNLDGIDWIIIGGESGPGARPLKIKWIEDILRQCSAANIPAFVKQLGSHWAKETQARADTSVRGRHLALTRANKLRIDRKGGEPKEWPEHLRVRMFPGEVWG